MPMTFNDVYDSPHCTINRYRRECGGQMAVIAVSYFLTDAIDFFNVSQTMSVQQIAQVAQMIVMNTEGYGWLKIDDFKLCFSRAKMGYYGKVFRLDGQVVFDWLNQYINERMSAADDASYQQHQNNKGSRDDGGEDLKDIIKRNVKK